MSDQADMDDLASRFLDLWQDNVRLWAVERDLLTPDDLAALLKTPPPVPEKDGHDR